MFDKLKLMFNPTPRWIKEVESHGSPATAVVISDPQPMLKGLGNYEGRDGWLDVQAHIQPPAEAEFDAAMKCKMSQALFGMLAPGMKVNVKYDAKDKTRVLLVDDVHILLSYRVKK